MQNILTSGFAQNANLDIIYQVVFALKSVIVVKAGISIMEPAILAMTVLQYLVLNVYLLQPNLQ